MEFLKGDACEAQNEIGGANDDIRVQDGAISRPDALKICFVGLIGESNREATSEARPRCSAL
jgi:hypothetical protein